MQQRRQKYTRRGDIHALRRLDATLRQDDSGNLATYYTKGKQMSFLWLIEHLLPPIERIKGFQIMFPDTYFFEDGRPKFFLRNDHQQFLIIDRNPGRLKLTDIRKNIPQVVRERRKLEEPMIPTIALDPEFLA